MSSKISDGDRRVLMSFYNCTECSSWGWVCHALRVPAQNTVTVQGTAEPHNHCVTPQVNRGKNEWQKCCSAGYFYSRVLSTPQRKRSEGKCEKSCVGRTRCSNHRVRSPAACGHCAGIFGVPCAESRTRPDKHTAACVEPSCGRFM